MLRARSPLRTEKLKAFLYIFKILKVHTDDINYEVAKEREKLVRHDVMSHVYAYGL